MKKTVYLLLFLVSSATCIAQNNDHLKPVDSFFWSNIYGKSDSILRSRLLNDLEDSPTVAILFAPSFSLANALLFLDSGSTHLLICKERVFKNELGWLVLHRSGVKTKTTTVVLDSITWNKLTALFLLALEKTKPLEEPIRWWDGDDTYFFSCTDPQKLVSGQLWSLQDGIIKHTRWPNKGSMMYELLGIQNEIIAIYIHQEYNTRIERKKLMKRVDALMARINGS